MGAVPVPPLFGLSTQTLAVFFRNLSTMVGAGLPIMRALDSLKSTTHGGRLKLIIEEMELELAAGRPFSTALAGRRGEISDYVVAMVEAGERGGQLDLRLQDVADTLERLHRLRMQTVKHLIYPAILIHAGIFLPPLYLVVAQGNMAGYLKATLLPLLVLYTVIAAIWLLGRYGGMMPSWRAAWEQLLRLIPVVGGIINRQALARLTRTFGDLYHAGLSPAQAANLAAAATDSPAMMRRMKRLGPLLDQGMSLTDSLRSLNIMPELALQLISTGEESGQVDEMLGRASRYMEEQAEQYTKRALAILPVILYAGLGIYTGYLLISQFTAIYAPLRQMH